MTNSMDSTDGTDTPAVGPHETAVDGAQDDLLDWLGRWRLWRELRAARFACQHSDNVAAWTRSNTRRQWYQREAEAARRCAAALCEELSMLGPQPADGCPGLQPGQSVIWLHVPRGGYGYVQPVAAEVIEIGEQRVRIRVKRPDGTAVERSVRPEHLRAS